MKKLKMIINHLDKPILHKKGKQWIVIGLSSLLMCSLGGTALMSNQQSHVHASTITKQAKHIHTMLLGSDSGDNYQLIHESGRYYGGNNKVSDRHEPASDTYSGDYWKSSNLTGTYDERAIGETGNTWLKANTTSARGMDSPYSISDGSYQGSNTQWINASKHGIKYKPYGAKHMKSPSAYRQSDEFSYQPINTKPTVHNVPKPQKQSSDKASDVNYLDEYTPTNYQPSDLPFSVVWENSGKTENHKGYTPKEQYIKSHFSKKHKKNKKNKRNKAKNRTRTKRAYRKRGKKRNKRAYTKKRKNRKGRKNRRKNRGRTIVRNRAYVRYSKGRYHRLKHVPRAWLRKAHREAYKAKHGKKKKVRDYKRGNTHYRVYDVY